MLLMLLQQLPPLYWMPITVDRRVGSTPERFADINRLSDFTMASSSGFQLLYVCSVKIFDDAIDVLHFIVAYTNDRMKM